MFNFSLSNAKAQIKGGKKYPLIKGTIYFKETKQGVIVTAKIQNLPNTKNAIFGLHIHEGESCTGNTQDEFANAQSHYNPNNTMHPQHSGDLPPLFGNNGYAYMSVLTNRFNIKDIIGKVIIIHDKPDDFTSQPSGNSGEKIACGKISLKVLK